MKKRDEIEEIDLKDVGEVVAKVAVPQYQTYILGSTANFSFDTRWANVVYDPTTGQYSFRVSATTNLDNNF